LRKSRLAGGLNTLLFFLPPQSALCTHLMTSVIISFLPS